MLDTDSFLNRRILNIKIDLTKRPETLKLFLHSTQTLTLYESSLPAEWFPSEGRIEVFIGKNPPIPLDISMTINRDADFTIKTEAGYPSVKSRVSINDDIFSVNRQRTITGNFPDVE